MEQRRDTQVSSRDPVQRLGASGVLWRTYQVSALFARIILELLWYGFRLKNQLPEVAGPRWNELFHRQAVRFRQAAEEMGGLLIKVGQFLSSRVDLLPKSIVEELATLQDRVRPDSWSHIVSVLHHELGPLDRSFLWFASEPLAAASLGQVYEAVLHDGTRVAVKVQRPEMRRIVEADLRALTWVVRLATRLTRFGRTFDLFVVLREFRKMVYQELDYHQELLNTERIREELRGMTNVHVPKTYPAFSTGRVLVMEFYQGVKINQPDVLRERGLSPTRIATQAIHLYLYMVMDEGLYHADPHPGNLLVSDDGSLVLLDYGMVGSLDTATKRHLRSLFVAVSEQRPGDLVESLQSLGMLRTGADKARLKQQVSYLFERYYAETLHQLNELDIKALLRDFEHLLQDQSIQIPGEFAFLGRAIAILVGLATALDPSINLIEIFTPYARRFVTEDAGGVAGYAARRASQWGRNIVELPGLLTHMLKDIDQGELEAKVHWDEGTQQIKRLALSIVTLTRALYVMGFAVLGAVLLTPHPIYAKVSFALAAVTWIVGSLRHRK